MRLALAFGVPVAQLQRTMDAHEFAEWRAFFQLQTQHNPDFASDIRAAIVAASVENSMRSKGSPTKVSDRMPFFDMDTDGRPKARTPEEIERMLGGREEGV